VTAAASATMAIVVKVALLNVLYQPNDNDRLAFQCRNTGLALMALSKRITSDQLSGFDKYPCEM
jgi:membrane peptidoglycan carboxypeptidase